MNDRLIHCMTALTCEVWLIDPQVHKMLTDICTAHAGGGNEEAAQHALAESMPNNPANRKYQVMGQTAVIPVEGVIGRKFSSSLKSSGVTSVDVLERMIKAAGNDDQINSLLLTFDSPGGIALGVPEAASAINQAKANGKTVVAYIDGLAASAAYWMAAQADVIVSMPSSQVGSVGAYMAVLDSSRAAEMAGYKVELFRSGPNKGMGMPGTSLTDAQRAMLQERVTKLGNDFKAAVRMGRGREIKDEVMQGQTFDAATALAHGLIDSVGDFDAALSGAQYLGKNPLKRK